jgi:hypothetical protein
MSEGFNVFAALRVRFSPPEFVFLEEVRSRTGYAGEVRYADALAVNCFASRGQFLHGVEVKVSRADWLAELKNPDKAEAIFKYCDFWWLAVPDASIVQNDLPPTWGLLAPRGKTLTAVVKAPKLSPQPLTISFLASILRSVTEKFVLAGNIQ